MNFPILSSLILLPTVGAFFLFFTKSKKENTQLQMIEGPILTRKLLLDKMQIFLMQLNKILPPTYQMNLIYLQNLSLSLVLDLKTIKSFILEKIVNWAKYSIMKKSLMKIIYSPQ